METSPDTIAVACPFCNLMMEDAIGAKQTPVKSRDIAELIWESLGKGDAGPVKTAEPPAPTEAPGLETTEDFPTTPA